MTRLSRSKSCSLDRVNDSIYDESGEVETEEEEEEEIQGYYGDNDSIDLDNTVTTPFMTPESRKQKGFNRRRNRNRNHHHDNHQYPILGALTAALRKSLVTCSVEIDDVASNMDIGSPTDVQHVSHVTFDRLSGSFLGLPVELQHHVPRRVPSASASVFGVSAESMQCSMDDRGHSIPTILLRVQRRLYSEGGLQAEGIFRINGENGQEENVRNQLNEGIIPRGIDVHCLAGLIKAWFRELPTGVLDSLTPEQVMRCNTEEECVQLVNLLPATEAGLLHWAIDLMVDVVEHECHNKMNARNIAMVFAPNMTQMADPLTALIHAVQVMNFLKTLIEKTFREREETASGISALACVESESNVVVDDDDSANASHKMESETREKLWNETLDRLENDVGEIKHRSPPSSRTVQQVMRKRRSLENRSKDGEEGEYDIEELEEGRADHKLSFREGVRKLYRHPVFQLSKSIKKREIVNVVKC